MAWVLSTGRTGTVFLTRTLPSGIPGLSVVHEPPGSRGTMMLGNFRNWTGVGRRVLRAKFRRELARRRGAVPPADRYVELNPLLCPLTDLVAELEEPLRLVHMVRDPRTWARSAIKFKASGYRRYIIDYLPFGTPYPSPRPAGWLSSSKVEKALHRWRYSNDEILALKPRCAAYELVRYEDLFSADAARSGDAKRRLIAGLGLEVPEDLEWFDTGVRHNPAPGRPEAEVDEALVQAICGPLLERFGYERP